MAAVGRAVRASDSSPGAAQWIAVGRRCRCRPGGFRCRGRWDRDVSSPTGGRQLPRMPLDHHPEQNQRSVPAAAGEAFSPGWHRRPAADGQIPEPAPLTLGNHLHATDEQALVQHAVDWVRAQVENRTWRAFQRTALVGQRARKAAKERAVARFYREMRAIGQLNHPNIVQAYDSREIDDAPLLVMELVDGFDLAELVRRLGPLDVADGCEIVRQTAMGLQHAYEHDLVHRDLKPSNPIMIATKSSKSPS